MLTQSKQQQLIARSMGDDGVGEGSECPPPVARKCQIGSLLPMGLQPQTGCLSGTVNAG